MGLGCQFGPGAPPTPSPPGPYKRAAVRVSTLTATTPTTARGAAAALGSSGAAALRPSRCAASPLHRRPPHATWEGAKPPAPNSVRHGRRPAGGQGPLPPGSSIFFSVAGQEDPTQIEGRSSLGLGLVANDQPVAVGFLPRARSCSSRGRGAPLRGCATIAVRARAGVPVLECPDAAVRARACLRARGRAVRH